MNRQVLRSAGWAAVLVLSLMAVGWPWLRPAGDAGHGDHDEDDHAAPMLFDAPPAGWTVVELIDAQGVARFERDADGHWLLHGTVAGEAPGHAHAANPNEARRIDAVFGTFSRVALERSLGVVGPDRLADYGLTKPALIVLVHGEEGRPSVTLEAGDLAPDGLSRYVRLPRTGQLATIANYQIEGLSALVRGPLAATRPASR
jgi:hypothetical protein